MGAKPRARRWAKADHPRLQAAATGDPRLSSPRWPVSAIASACCGLSPIYASLAFAARKGSGKLIGYEQCAADEAGDSFVSIAAMTV